MPNVIKQPCDEGVIRSKEAESPCAPNAGPWVLVATILGTRAWRSLTRPP